MTGPSAGIAPVVTVARAPVVTVARVRVVTVARAPVAPAVTLTVPVREPPMAARVPVARVLQARVPVARVRAR